MHDDLSELDLIYHCPGTKFVFLVTPTKSVPTQTCTLLSALLLQKPGNFLKIQAATILTDKLYCFSMAFQ